MSKDERTAGRVEACPQAGEWALWAEGPTRVAARMSTTDASFAAAGWNLLVTLEEMEAVAWLESLPAIMRVQNFAPFEIEMVQRIAAAIRTALSPSTPSGSTE